MSAMHAKDVLDPTLPGGNIYPWSPSYIGKPKASICEEIQARSLEVLPDMTDW